MLTFSFKNSVLSSQKGNLFKIHTKGGTAIRRTILYFKSTIRLYACLIELLSRLICFLAIQALCISSIYAEDCKDFAKMLILYKLFKINISNIFHQAISSKLSHRTCLYISRPLHEECSKHLC